MIRIIKALKKDKWVRPFLTGYKKILVLTFTLGFFTIFFSEVSMFNSGYLISRSASSPNNILMIYVPIVLTRVLGIARPLFRYLERLISHKWVLKISSKLRIHLYSVLEKEAIFFKNNHNFGDIFGLLNQDINLFQNFYLRTIFPTITFWILYLITILILSFYSWKFAILISFLFFLVSFLIPLYSFFFYSSQQEKEKKKKNKLYIELTDNLLGISDWIFSQRIHDYMKLHEYSQKKLLLITSVINKFNLRRDLFSQGIFGIIIVTSILWTGEHFVNTGLEEVNWIAAFILGIFPMINFSSNLASAAQEINIYTDSFKRFNTLSEKADKRYKNKLTLPNILHIKMYNLTFYYDKKKKLLHNLNLSIPSGEKLAILGRSGSGKTTLLSLIRGDLIPKGGNITLGGIPTNDFGDKISDYISVIQQFPYLFHATILDNLRIGNPNASIEEIWNVLSRVGLKNLVKNLPMGLNTVLQESGSFFSGGERHCIALARVLLKDNPIVLLDEPTIGLDPITEKNIIDIFCKELKDKTVIWITHHLQGVSHMKKVIFLENGKLKMSGSPFELFKSNLHYRKLKIIDEGR